MIIKRFNELQAGPPHPGQKNMCGFPLHKTEYFFMGLTHYLPGGGVPETSPNARADSIITYFVLDGELTIEDKNPITLGKYDSVSLSIGECNQLKNNTNAVTTVLVVIGGPNAGPKHLE